MPTYDTIDKRCENVEYHLSRIDEELESLALMDVISWDIVRECQMKLDIMRTHIGHALNMHGRKQHE